MARKRLRCYFKKDVEKFRQQGRETALELFMKEANIHYLLSRVMPVPPPSIYNAPCCWDIPTQVSYDSITKEE